MLIPIPPPYEFRFVNSGPYNMCVTDISMDLDLQWNISAAAGLQDMGDGRHELVHGIYVYDLDLETDWMVFDRKKAKATYHFDVKLAVLDLFHEGTKRLLDRLQPQTIICKTEEPMPLNELPERFKATICFLESHGYPQSCIYQADDLRWHWGHNRRRSPERTITREPV